MSAFGAVNPSAAFTRRHDLDWLRIIAFGLLIFYHIGVFYESDGWHAASVYQLPQLEPFMGLSNPWRLPLLFFISGVAIRFLSDKLGALRFGADRSWRLFPVILFGMYVVVAPQSYVEVTRTGQFSGNFMEFYRLYAGEWAGPWSIHTPTWNHLWYVVYLFVYSLLLVPFLPLLRRLADSRAMAWLGRQFNRKLPGSLLIIALPVLPLLFYRFTLVPAYPVTHALLDDWANHAISLTFLLYGFLIAKNAAAWQGVYRTLPLTGVLTLIAMASLFTAYLNWKAVQADEGLLLAARIARVVFAWTMILTLAGLAHRFLDRDGPIRRYFTEAIFPYYILHQTIIVVVGQWLTGFALGVGVEFGLLTLATVGGCAIGYELVRRIPPLRPVFGLKLAARRRTVSHARPAG
ncbi:acyltransferase family protein [Hyphobacterium sp.]|uniref:acyltransferase family protein n=1 Tax=Hyphobacterium sp. TaxID=2004662 RepID=UPI003B52754E